MREDVGGVEITPLSLIIFDLDGTLIDSKVDIANSVNHALAQESFPTLPPAKIQSFVGHGLSHLVRDVLGEPTAEEVQRVAMAFWQHYMEHSLDETVLYPGVMEFLAENPDLPKAVVTNKPYALSKRILDGLKIDHHFRWLIGGDSLPVQKPSPETLKPILNEFPPHSKILMVGDSQIDVDCGRGAGILTCGVTYGYRDREELVQAKADFLIDRFEDLKDLPLFKKNSHAS